ncbi:hypothetical protein [Actinoplanes sp. URMC 104]|uniref:hypothetical protein n=1 Tax=Actinoplanes sp. URMC 104 TaxID=3423409 RepID=UPI003F1C9C7A
MKRWLRGNGHVEFLPEPDWRSTPGQDARESAPRRSILRELLDEADAERLEVEPGRWFLPGTPP